MNWIVCFIAFILGAISMFTLVFIGYITKSEEPVNKVKFFVARDMDDNLWLYMGKPNRGVNEFEPASNEYCIVLTDCNFKSFGLNKDDFKDLKWEDEPLEVFLNMEY